MKIARINEMKIELAVSLHSRVRVRVAAALRHVSVQIIATTVHACKWIEVQVSDKNSFIIRELGRLYFAK